MQFYSGIFVLAARTEVVIHQRSAGAGKYPFKPRLARQCSQASVYRKTPTRRATS